MSGFFRFPAMAKLAEWDNADQIEKLKEELNEAIDAYYKNGDVTAFGVELMNVIHTSETALRMNFNEKEAELLRQLTIEKNRKRGYYGEEEDNA